MQKEKVIQILVVFLSRVIGISKKYEMGQAFIQGQLEEACHQLELYYKKAYGSFHHEF